LEETVTSLPRHKALRMSLWCFGSGGTNRTGTGLGRSIGGRWAEGFMFVRQPARDLEWAGAAEAPGRFFWYWHRYNIARNAGRRLLRTRRTQGRNPARKAVGKKPAAGDRRVQTEGNRLTGAKHSQTPVACNGVRARLRDSGLLQLQNRAGALARLAVTGLGRGLGQFPGGLTSNPAPQWRHRFWSL